MVSEAHQLRPKNVFHTYIHVSILPYYSPSKFTQQYYRCSNLRDFSKHSSLITALIRQWVEHNNFIVVGNSSQIPPPLSLLCSLLIYSPSPSASITTLFCYHMTRTDRAIQEVLEGLYLTDTDRIHSQVRTQFFLSLSLQTILPLHTHSYSISPP